MGKVIIVKKKTIEPLNKRFCLNCGADISHKHKNAKFCCTGCCDSYGRYFNGWKNNYTSSDAIKDGWNRRLFNNYGYNKFNGSSYQGDLR